MPKQRKPEKRNDFLRKLKKVVCIVLYGLVFSQSDCSRTCPYQLSYNNEYDFSDKFEMVASFPRQQQTSELKSSDI